MNSSEEDNPQSLVESETIEEKPAKSKKFLIAGIVLVLIIVLYATTTALLPTIMQGLQARVNNYDEGFINKTLPVITSSWDPKDFKRYASPELLQEVQTDKKNTLDKLMNACKRKLGTMKHFEKSFKSFNVNTNLSSGSVKTANYTINAEFEKGEATIEIGLIQHNGKWQYLGFNVNSVAFLE